MTLIRSRPRLRPAWSGKRFWVWHITRRTAESREATVVEPFATLTRIWKESA